MKRIESVNKQIQDRETKNRTYQQLRSPVKSDWFKNQGWGYKDTEFALDDDGIVYLSGNRYKFSGERMPIFRQWAEEVIGLDMNQCTPLQKEIPIAPALVN